MQVNKYPTVVLLLAIILFTISCGSSTTKDHPAYHNPAVQPFTDSIEAEPGNAAYYFRRAEALSNIDLDSLALEDVRTAQELDKTNPQYNFTIGYLLLELDKPQEAVKVLLQNLEQSPGNVNVRLLLAKAYIAVRNPAAAEEQITKILAAAPQHIPAQMMQARIKAAQKDTTGAIQMMKNVLAADPRNYEASFLLADWYKASGNPEAITQYRTTFGMDTTNADPLYEIGAFYEREQQVEKAKEAYRRCIKMDMDYTDAYLQIGKILLAQDSNEKALRHFNLSVNTRPNSAEGYFHKGLCFEKLQQKDSAVAAYRQALIFDQGLTEAVDGLKRLKK